MATENGDRKEERFAVAAGSELSVSNVSGRTTVKADDGSEIVVRYHRRGSKGLESAQVEVEKSGNRVSVQTRSKPTGLLNFSRSSPVEYDISVPRDCAVSLHAVSAEISLEGTRGDTGIRTVSGKVRIANVAGDISVTSVSGDVEGRGLAGTFIGRSTSGDTSVLSSRLRRFSLNSVSGDFTIETPLVVDEQCNAKTVSGDLDLLLPAADGATVQLRSVSGSVSCELPAEIIKSGRRHWQGRINGGGGHVEMNSVSGDLKVRVSRASGLGPSSETSSQAGSASYKPSESNHALSPSDFDVAAASGSRSDDARDDPPASEPDIASVLAAVERGEISIEDAMIQIG